MIPREFMASDALDVMTSFADDFESVSVRDAFEAIKPDVREAFASNFANTRAPYGTWPPHSPYTVARYGPHPLLILSGAMLASVTTSGASESIEETGDRYMVLGTGFFYAPYQQFGTRKIPPRPFLWLTGDAADQISEKFLDACWTILV
jgi:hypothetical protein